MKKNLKRALSVFMAAVMLLTCWVFVAPQKAEAANSDTYDWKVQLMVMDDYDWKHDAMNIYVDGCPNNGTTTSHTVDSNSYFHVNSNQFENDDANYTFYGTSVNFPTRVRLSAMKNNNSVWNANYKCILSVKDNDDGSWVMLADSGKVTGIKKGNNLKNLDVSINTSASYWPKVARIDTPSGSTSVTIPKTGASNTTSSYTAITYDQYGVKWYKNSQFCINDTKPNNYTEAKRDNVDGCSIEGYPGVLTVKPERQLAGSTNSKDVYVSVVNPDSASVYNTLKVTLNDPKYTFTYNKNNGTSLNVNSATKQYGTPVGSGAIPTSGVRTGYEFIGMYESAKANSYAAVKPTAGSTSGYTGQLTTSAAVNTDKTWYAAWWAKNAKVTFRNIDETIVASYTTGKYDRSVGQSAISTPEVEYIREPGQTGTFKYTFAGWVVAEAKRYKADGTQEDYNDAIGQSASDFIIQGDTVFEPVFNIDLENYTVTFYDGNDIVSTNAEYHYRDTINQPLSRTKDPDPTFTYVFKGWTVRSDESAPKQFIVDENGFTDENVPIPLADDAAFIVRRNVSFASVFEKVYKNYTVRFTYDGAFRKTVLEGVHYGAAVDVPTPAESYTNGGDRYTFTGEWYDNLDCTGTPVVPSTCSGNKDYYAKYDKEPAVYTIQFFDYDGTPLLPDDATQYEHSRSVIYNGQSAEAYAYSRVSKQWDDGENRYFFQQWTPGFSSTALNDVNYTPEYSSVPLYTVNYYYGDELLESAKEISDEAVPAYTGTIPEKPADAYALDGYTFTGWATAENEEVTVMPATDINLYAQFTCEPTVYTVTFKRDVDDLEPISSFTYHYGEPIVEPTDAACAKPDDPTYHYYFIGWNHNIAHTCEGDAVYTARYRKSYVLYPVIWENEDESTFVSTNYIYNERVNPPYIIPTTTLHSPDENYAYQFKGWKYKDTNEDFERGIQMTGGHMVDGVIRLVPEFELVPRTCEVKLCNEDGSEVLGTLNLPFGTPVADIAAYLDPTKNSTEEKHYIFDGWNDTDGNPWSGLIVDNIELRARFTEADHDFSDVIVITYPTFFTVGSATLRCTCGKEKLGQEITEISDEKSPTSKLYVGGHSWTEAQEIDNDPIPTAATNIVIINGDDKADPELYNLEGIGSGVGTISFFVAKEENLPESVEDITGWITRFDYGEALEHGITLAEANATGYIGDLLYAFFGEDFENEPNYVIYGKLTDRKGNVSYINTPLLKFDSEAPVVTVTGDCSSGSKHCVKATINVESEDIATVILDGVAQEPTVGSYEVITPGQHQGDVTDLAGNSTKVNFQIIGSHSAEVYTVQPTCDDDGYTVTKCKLCGSEISEHEVITSDGHNFVAGNTVPATCLDEGYTKYTCTKCFKTEKRDIVSASGAHTWNEGYVVSEATCLSEGLKLLTCTVCNETTTQVIPLDGNAHSYYRPVTQKPTCTEAGKKYETCKYCGHENVIENLEATGHTADGVWVVTVPATCTEEGTKVQYCKNCNTTEAVISGDINPLGHSYVVDHVVPHTATAQGYTVYKCGRCGATKEDDYTGQLDSYTVRFFSDDGETELASFTKAEGETITAADVEEPTKAADNTYTYEFAGWVDADNNAVSLPITVTADMTLKATFTSKYNLYTITFYKEDGVTYFDSVGFKHNGDTVEKNGPTKAADAFNTYTFLGWVPVEDSTAEPVKIITVTGNASYKAMYSETAKTYTVTWAIDSNTVLEVLQNVPAGSSVSFSKATPTKSGHKGEEGHYQFAGWDKETTNVSSNLFVYAQFEVVPHSYDTITSVSATCTAGAGTSYTCSCGYSYEERTGSGIGHDFSIVLENIPATTSAAGRVKKKCSRCDETQTTTIPKLTQIKVKVNVKDQKGNPVGGVLVSLFDGNTLVSSARTDESGTVIFYVLESKNYRIEIEGAGSSDITVNPNGTITGDIPVVQVEEPCNCACHRDGLWPSIFRFFHKIIKMLVGDFVCCGDPDSRYN